MNLLSRDELREILGNQRDRCVSLFLPTHRAGTDVQQDPIRMRNLAREAEKLLQEQGVKASSVREWTRPVQDLIEDDMFWQHQSDGLGVFLSKGFFRFYRVPIALTELVHVGSRFHVAPLMPLLVGDQPFFLLALSKNDVRFFQGTKHSMRELEVPGVPLSLAEALQWDDPEKQQQFRSLAMASRGTAMFHGHGAEAEDNKDNLRRFFHLVSKGLEPMLNGQSAPLVLAGVDYYFPLYAEANTYPHLLAGGVHGNIAGIKPDDLHRKAWEIMQPYVDQARQAAADRYRTLSGNGKSSCVVTEIVPASHQGRVDLLFTPVGVQTWGRFDADSGEVRVSEGRQPGDEDLLNVAAVQTFLHGGTVYAVAQNDMPDSAAAAAVYRY